ncbi:MAG: c-type cytochrome domain-containing protein [Planctomycetota bacterium]
MTIRSRNQLCHSWLACLVLTTILGWSLGTPGVAPAQEKVDFVKQVQPILEKHCFECHGADEDENNGFSISIKSEAGDYFVEESAEDSEIYLLMTSDDEDEVMPPTDYEHQLSDEDKELVKRWLDEGADWPDDVTFVKYEGEPQDTNDDPGGDTVAEKQTDESGSTSEENADEAAAEPAPLDPKVENLMKAAGSLHPAAVHIPIGLILAAGFFALLSLRGSFVMSDCAYYCLWLGALGAIVASGTGWYWSWMENKGTVEVFADIFDSNQKVYWHRLGGLIITILSFILALFAASARSKDPDEGVMWKLGAILLAIGVAWVGHTGGELQYGSDHDKYIHAVWEDLTGGGGEENGEGEDGADENADADGDGEAEDDPVAKKDADDARAALAGGQGSDDDSEDDTSLVGKTSGEQ